MLKCFYKNQECFLFMFDALSKSMNAYSKEEGIYEEKTPSGKFGKTHFLVFKKFDSGWFTHLVR